jgi:aryl-alcohol dehydrogenase-like predicted oxidoreductase
MKQLPFIDAGLGVSRLGFGCAPIMGRVGARQALDALACAFDHGVTHFDVARSYGFGGAERILGRFIAGKRHRVTVTSKFGVVVPELNVWQRLARPVVRPLLGVLAPLRRRVRQSTHELQLQRRFDVGYARQCLQMSLTQLNTDYLDCYLVHEPDLNTLVDADRLWQFLDDQRRDGRIRAWGLAHPHWSGAGPPIEGRAQVLQIESPASSGAPLAMADGEARFLFVTRPLAGGAYTPTPTTPESGDRLGLNPLQLAMAMACACVGDRGAVVAGMFQRAHIEQNARAIEHYDENRAQIDLALADWGAPVRDRRARSAG